ncbi:hypothetical protein AVDCRST_MAG81-1769 [uncultured Synechococcales cyanobacterium]|uniref:Uncharacterized protein n=1 Tax=uncultured Synechococcales cyanobacterium TaxID=1936017 RepID=A0A6J4VDU0_9CYAN|nr:hypothetical protein AVDCRST_MAG81-1769 [uncultured Synechococcales cyanobacterium]
MDLCTGGTSILTSATSPEIAFVKRYIGKTVATTLSFGGWEEAPVPGGVTLVELHPEMANSAISKVNKIGG